ncbi:riboflavin kinase [Methylopila henanensis]|uniref:Riboflavin kinase n=1 Tax=Methylopila henanensis TaxID=873516 RepID=A0ABW4KAI0_9HYPH
MTSLERLSIGQAEDAAAPIASNRLRRGKRVDKSTSCRVVELPGSMDGGGEHQLFSESGYKSAAAASPALPQWLRHSYLVIGAFAGVHREHARTLEYAFRLARAARSRVVVLIIRSVHDEEQVAGRLLIDDEEKARLLIDAGASGVVTLAVDDELSEMDCQAFVEEIVIGRFGASGVIVDARLDLMLAEAVTPATLARVTPVQGVSLHVVPARPDHARVQAGKVLDLLDAGDVSGASKLLGRHWLVEGVVCHGDKRGRELGVPTANIRLPSETRLGHGVYAVRTLVGRRVLAGVASFGTRPQFDDGAPLLEVHLFRFDGDLYGQTLRVEFIEKLRPEQVFPSIEALCEQMATDIRDAAACIELYDRSVKSALTNILPLSTTPLKL